MKKILLVSGILLGLSFFAPCSAQQGQYYDFDSLSIGMTSPGGRVLSLALFKDSIGPSPLFAGGHFTIAGRQPALNIAEWVYTTNNYIAYSPPQGKWVALGSGINNDVCALAMYSNHLYAGGKFDTAGGIAANHIARWDTSAKKWDSLVGQLNGNVYALCVYHNTLYAGGDFTIADGDTVNRIAAWNGSAWAPAGKGFDTGAVFALAVSNDTLYAGGSFIKSGATILNHIAKLSGSSWESLGVGTNNTVYALTDYSQSLCIGGAFTASGGIANRYLSFFDDFATYTWNNYVDNVVNDTVRALCIGYFPVFSINKPRKVYSNFADMLLIGGNFDSANGITDRYFATDLFGNGNVSQLGGPVYALASQPMEINYAGGEFKSAENDDSTFIEPLNNITVLTLHNLGGGVASLSNQVDIKVYPNPSKGNFTLSLSHPDLASGETGSQTIEIYNMLGAKVYDGMLILPKARQHVYQLNLLAQPNGIYLYRLLTNHGNLIGQGKLVIQK